MPEDSTSPQDPASVQEAAATPPPPPPPPSGEPSPPPPSPGNAARRVRRDTAEGMVGGVAAGFARHFAIDVAWIRLAFVLLTVFGGGVGIVLYLAAWLIVPEGDDRDAGSGTRSGRSANRARDPEASGRGTSFWAGVGLIAIGGLILLDTVLDPLEARMGWISTGDIIFPLVLIGIGALIYRSSRGEDVVPVALRNDGEGTLEDRIERWSDDVEQRAEAFEARQESRAAERRAAGERSRVAPVTLGLALLSLGVIWLLGSLGIDGLTFGRAVAAALLVVGAGLVVGAFLGRGRGLVATGILLTPVVLVATLVPQLPGGLAAVSVTEDGFVVQDDGPFVERPSSLDALADAYEFGVGSATIDLRGLDRDALARAGTTELRIALGIGDLRVRLPEHVTVEVSVELGIGRIDLAGSTTAGLGQDTSVRLAGTTPEDGRLVLIIEQGIGAVTVTR